MTLNLIRLGSLLFLLVILLVSLCTAGYVIFFRTVISQQTAPSKKSAIACVERQPLVYYSECPPKGERSDPPA